ncbi:hypothetical protein MM236_10695 [Belliella sp. DSM 107340]|uniref:Antitoxin component YwqK of the YwqJK toxin-antitoxin module n=1 Tax=Belliella calami TaxID=2923436 RepID=A0ABS9UPB5_9BACT|nr:hypothetical protein [Belliella calami]MCH7398461.1 hypothetical protein [Belliella calami]
MRRFQKLVYIVIILFLILPNHLIAQNEFDGEYKFNNINGKATFRLVEGQEGAMLKHGEFNFVRSEKDIDDDTRFLKTIIQGFYESDQKSGLWEYLDEKHEIELKDVVDFRVVSDLTSSQIKLKANYLNGVPNGKWVFEENVFSDGSLKKKAQAEEFLFNNGDIKGKFQFKSFSGNFTQFIRGELKDDGVMHGEWTMVYQEEGKLISEVRNYEDGFLLGLVKRDLNDDEVIDEVVFFETIARLKKVNAGQNEKFRIADQSFGILFNDGFLSNSNQYQSQESGNKFLSDFLVKILKYDQSFVNQDDMLVEYPIHTKKFVFELSRAQQKLIEELPSKFDQIQKINEDYKERNALKLNRQRSDSLSSAFAFFEFQFDKLNNSKELIEKIRSKDIQYYDLDQIVDEGIFFITTEDEIHYTFQDEDKILVLDYEVMDFREDFFVALNDYLNQVREYTLQTRNYVDGQLNRIKEDSDLILLEEEIQSLKENLDSLYSNVGELDEFSRTIISNVQTNILDDQFGRINERYAQAERYSTKKEEANRMLDLVEELGNQFEPLSNISRNWEILDEYYMEEFFNAFFNERYDRRFKERLFESGERLYEHYVNSIKNETNYVEIKSWTRKIEALIRRMSDLRNEDTRSLERRLNRRSSIEKIESDLGI